MDNKESQAEKSPTGQMQSTPRSTKPWESEPDEKRFIDEETSYPVVLKRGPHGGWCGYIGVPATHSWFGKSYSEPVSVPEPVLHRAINVDKIGAINLLCAGMHGKPSAESLDIVLAVDVHGGLTWSDKCAAGDEPDGNWWFGFDCAHAGDLSPKYDRYRARDLETTRDVYRDLPYAEREARNLARQLRQFAPSVSSAPSADNASYSPKTNTEIQTQTGPVRTI